MATYEISPAHGAGAKLPHPAELACFALIVANIVYLLAFYLQGSWLIGPDGHGIITDFVTEWAAGRMALTGHAAAAYDWTTLKQIEQSAAGQSFHGYLGWPYPPTFFFLVAPLALLPYTSALIVFALSSFVGYLAAMRAIIGDRVGYFVGAAFPPVLANFMVGQNGFLSAGLIGGTLIFMDTQPTIAGVLLGFLTYKPHLGLLFPIALAASGRWRVFATAAIVAAVMAAASWAVFGGAVWQAFLPGVDHMSQALLFHGLASFGKLQTLFGLVRTLHGSEALAWSLQTMLALATAGAILILWRSRAAFDIKAAALATGALLVTPYLFTYDLAILAVPIAFLVRIGRMGGFLPCELAGIGAACGLILLFPFVQEPVGFGAIAVVAALVARRALAPGAWPQNMAA